MDPLGKDSADDSKRHKKVRKESMLWVYGVVVAATTRWVASTAVVGFVGYTAQRYFGTWVFYLGIGVGALWGGWVWFRTLKRELVDLDS